MYNLSFVFFLFFVLVTLRLTKRAKGFRLTPMDFLVLFITLVFLVLPELRLQYGLMAVKTIILFFCYEIIMGEVREKIGKG